MKILNIVLIYIIITPPLYAQKGYYVQKDLRIKRNQKHMVDFLLAHHQFGVNSSSLKMDEYYGKMYVQKELEVFKDNFLLVSFGSLADHGEKYWGVLTSKDYLLFTSGLEGEKIPKNLPVQTLKYYDILQTYISTFIKKNEEEIVIIKKH